MSKGPPDDELISLRKLNTELHDKLQKVIKERHVPYGSSNANLYLTSPKSTEPKGWVEKIRRVVSPVRLFQLKPFGEPHDPMAASALYFAMWIMSGIFIMEFVGWSLLFNEVLNRGVLTLSWRTLPAAFFGWIFAICIIALEQAILTAAVVDGWGKKKGVLLIRLVLIACSAAITTQPYELLWFNSEVNDRIHQESVRAEMTRRYPYYMLFKQGASSTSAAAPADTTAAVPPNQQQGHAANPAANWLTLADERCSEPQTVAEPQVIKGPTEEPDIYDARRTDILRQFYAAHQADCTAVLEQIPIRLSQIKDGLNTATASRDSSLSQINRAAPNCDETQKDLACARTLDGLRSSYSAWVGTVAKLTAEQANVQGAQTRLTLNREGFARRMPGEAQANNPLLDLDEGAAATPETNRKRMRAFQVYLTKLAASKAGDLVQLEKYRNQEEPPFKDEEYGVTKKIRCLYDELSRQPYKWDIDSVTKSEIENLFGLRDPVKPGWTLYTFLPWASVLVAAMFLPFVSLGYKLTLNENLNLYYVTEFQAQLGHVGAMMATEAKRNFYESRPRKPKVRLATWLDSIFRRTGGPAPKQPPPPDGPSKTAADHPADDRVRQEESEYESPGYRDAVGADEAEPGSSSQRPRETYADSYPESGDGGRSYPSHQEDQEMVEPTDDEELGDNSQRQEDRKPLTEPYSPVNGKAPGKPPADVHDHGFDPKDNLEV